MSNPRYDWKNLTPAEKLVQKTADGFTVSWFAAFETRLLPVAVKLANRVLYLERKVRKLNAANKPSKLHTGNEPNAEMKKGW